MYKKPCDYSKSHVPIIANIIYPILSEMNSAIFSSMHLLSVVLFLQLRFEQLQFEQLQFEQLQFEQLQFEQLQFEQLQFEQLQFEQLQFEQLQFCKTFIDSIVSDTEDIYYINT